MGIWFKNWLWLLWVAPLLVILVIFRILKSSLTWLIVGILLLFIGYAISNSQSYYSNYGSMGYSEIGAFAQVFGLLLTVLAFVRRLYKWDSKIGQQKNERARFLMMPQDEAQKYVFSVQDPQLRIKLIKDWQRNHISTQL